MAEASDLTPLEWLARLGPKLVERQETVRYWRRYYVGDHDLPAGPSQHKEAFVRFQKLARTNLCYLAVESCVHRTTAIGFRDANAPTDDTLWQQLWQGARLDARQFTLWRKAYAFGAAYAIAGVDPRRPRTPRVTIEGPESVIVETDPGDPSRRLAALRLWYDSIAHRWMATLYLPGERHHWQTVKQQKTSDGSARLSWKPQAWELRAEPARSTPEVPVIPFLNGDEGEDPAAEFAPGLDVQNRLNLTVLNRLTSERYAAFRQTILLNYKVEEDPVTGMPIAPWKPGVTQIGTIPPPDEPGDPEPKLVQLQQTDTSQILRGIEADMRAFAAVTLTPVYYLPGDLVNIGADSVAALDAGHIAKVKQRMATWGEGLEELMQLMADIAGIDRDLSSSEIVWARPESFQPAAVADYASKLRATGMPLPMVAEEIGWSPQRINQLRAEMVAETTRGAVAAALQQTQTPRTAAS